MKAELTAVPVGAATVGETASASGGMLRWAVLVARLTIAVILAQTLFFKFTFAPETQVIFRDIGGRPAATVAGLAELACVILLLVGRTAPLGALLALGTMAGALATHLFLIGIQVVDPVTGAGDGGLLFRLALIVSVLSSFILVARRRDLLPFLNAILRR